MVWSLFFIPVACKTSVRPLRLCPIFFARVVNPIVLTFNPASFVHTFWLLHQSYLDLQDLLMSWYCSAALSGCTELGRAVCLVVTCNHIHIATAVYEANHLLLNYYQYFTIPHTQINFQLFNRPIVLYRFQTWAHSTSTLSINNGNGHLFMCELAHKKNSEPCQNPIITGPHLTILQLSGTIYTSVYLKQMEQQLETVYIWLQYQNKTPHPKYLQSRTTAINQSIPSLQSILAGATQFRYNTLTVFHNTASKNMFVALCLFFPQTFHNTKIVDLFHTEIPFSYENFILPLHLFW